jgi:hypothetical protein
MNQYLDETQFRYVERDTDSLYFAISGDKNDKEGINQGFKHIIINE